MTCSTGSARAANWPLCRRYILRTFEVGRMGRRSHPGEISRGAPLPAARELFGLLSSPPEPVTLTILATIQSAIS
jgi:hypothetical protein